MFTGNSALGKRLRPNDIALPDLPAPDLPSVQAEIYSRSSIRASQPIENNESSVLSRIGDGTRRLLQI